MINDTPHKRFPQALSQEIKQRASGQWQPIIGSICNLDDSIMDGRHHPCPLCGGTDRFRVFDDFDTTGGMMCNQCHAENNGDGLSSVMWLLNCDFPEAVQRLADALGIQPSINSKASGQQARIVETYDYRQEDGTLLFQALRMKPKSFRQRKPKDGGGWDWSVKGLRKIPYHLPDLVGRSGEVVHIVEGEKDADRLLELGLLATCNAGGAGKWTADHSAFLSGRNVVILPDNDEPGRQHAQSVALSLMGIAREVKVVELPGLPEKGDTSDWLNAGGSVDDLKRLADGCDEWTPPGVHDPWPEIESIETDEREPFPVEVLPSPIREWVEEITISQQVPADLPAMIVLAAVRTAIRGRVYIEPWRGWREPANLFVVVGLDPANRKSSIFRAAVQPVRDIEREHRESATPFVKQAQSEHRQLELRLKKLEKRAGEHDDDDAKEEAREVVEQLVAPPLVKLPRWIVENATPEKVEITLSEQAGILSVMSPEGGVFDILAGQYSSSASGTASLDVWLKGHAGDDIVTERVNRDAVCIDNPSLTAGFAVQPNVFKMLGGNAVFRGRGLLGRFLYAMPESPVGDRQTKPEPMSHDVDAAYSDLIRKLTQIEIPGDGLTLTLTKSAENCFFDHAEWIENELGAGGILSEMTDWGGKLSGATLRIAANLHLVETLGQSQEISEKTMQAAITVARYLVPHADYVFEAMNQSNHQGGELSDARYLLRWIRRGQREEFSRRDAHQSARRKFATVEELVDPLNFLVAHNYIREIPVLNHKPGRPASPRYQTNPAIFDFKPPEGCTQKPQYPEKVDAVDSIEVCEDTIRGIQNQKTSTPVTEDVEVF